MKTTNISNLISILRLYRSNVDYFSQIDFHFYDLHLYLDGHHKYFNHKTKIFIGFNYFGPNKNNSWATNQNVIDEIFITLLNRSIGKEKLIDYKLVRWLINNYKFSLLPGPINKEMFYKWE